MNVTLRRLTAEDADLVPVTPGLVFVEQLEVHARTGRGPQGFGVCLDGRLAGYVEASAAVRDGLAPGDVNIAYEVQPWARGQGVAVEAVRLIGAFVRRRAIGSRAAIRVEPSNHASVRVAQKCGFYVVRDFVSSVDPVTYRLYVKPVQLFEV